MALAQFPLDVTVLGDTVWCPPGIRPGFPGGFFVFVLAFFKKSVYYWLVRFGRYLIKEIIMADKTIKFADSDITAVIACIKTQMGVFERAANKAARDNEPQLVEFYNIRMRELDTLANRFRTA